MVSPMWWQIGSQNLCSHWLPPAAMSKAEKLRAQPVLGLRKSSTRRPASLRGATARGGRGTGWALKVRCCCC
eukprot:scaffold30695_cov61-Phaeocystis_antarctica.AAC.3